MSGIDIKGRKFGYLTALTYKGRQKDSYAWTVVCDCGNSFTVLLKDLLSGKLTSCTLPMSRVCYMEQQAASQRTVDDELKKQMREDMRKLEREQGKFDVFRNTRVK